MRIHSIVRTAWIPSLAAALWLASGRAQAADAAVDAPALRVMVDTVWVILCGALVFFMNAGFALLETGLNRAKNAVNILAKNFTVAAIAGLTFYGIGFAMMFGDGNPIVGMHGLLLQGADNSPATGDQYQGVFSALNWTGVPLEAKFFFQAAFAMTAASIVSGAVAERIKFQSFVVFSVLLVAVVYPITGHWIWGGGWLASLGFWDFAGSTQVHSVGGWAALIGVLILGPRKGKYGKNGEINPIPGHNMAIATLGAFILWLGWFGFNAGSTMAADPTAISHIASTTLLASMAGTIGAMVASYVRSRTFDLSLILNGCLAGLVGITAGTAFVSTGSAVIIGLIGGLLVVPAVSFFDRVRADDPVGATSVHLVAGIWGTLAVGLFAQAEYSEAVGNGLLFGGGVKLLGVQALGVLVIGAFVCGASALMWLAVRKLTGLRATAEEEALGLDLTEMGMTAYPVETIPRHGLPEEEGAPVPVMQPAPAPSFKSEG